MTDRLSKLVAIFEGLDLSGNRAEGDDLLGDAYEYLMRHFATESGKSKGQFYTPAEVSRILAKVIGISWRNPPRRRRSRVWAAWSTIPAVMNSAALKLAWLRMWKIATVAAAGVPKPRSMVIRPRWLTVE